MKHPGSNNVNELNSAGCTSSGATIADANDAHRAANRARFFWRGWADEAVNEKMLHFSAAFMLLLFSVSHFGFLLVYNPEGISRNTVFPFLTNDLVYLVAGLFEFFTAVLIFVYRGRSMASLAILTFVGIILAYRWGGYFTDGRHCGCLGLLGRLLHVSKNFEQLIPRLALLYLIVTALPWISRVGRNFLTRLRGKAAIVILTLTPVLANADGQTIVVHGEYGGAAYNPETGESYDDNRKVRGTFAVSLSGEHWKICATNSNTGAVGELWYDGKDAYFRLSPVAYGQPASNVTFVTISSSPLFLPFDDKQHLTILWLAYVFSPKMLPKNGSIPVPWGGVRHNTAAYGYRWKVVQSDNDRFVSKINFVLDHNLDLKDRDELLRPEFVFPMESQDSYNAAITGIGQRRLLPDGFVKGTYQVTDWFQTNGVSIPKKAKLESNFSGVDNWDGKKHYNYPSLLLNLSATGFEVNDADIDTAPPLTDNTQIIDFRYRKIESERVFRGAEYALNSSDAWKSDHDPALLAAREKYLKNAPKITGSGIIVGYKNYLVWFLSAIMIAVSAAIILKKSKQKQRQ